MTRTFQYHRPLSIEEACALKAEYGDTAQFLGGGTDLHIEWKRGIRSFAHCIDISRIPALRGIQYEYGHASVRIGAATTLADIITAGDVVDHGPIACLKEAARHMATPQLRNVATVGGNLCHASPCADMGVVLNLLRGEAHLQSATGCRSITMSGFFVGVNQTVLESDELLTSLSVRVPEGPTSAVYLRATRTSIDLAQASVGVYLGMEDRAVADARIVVGACAPVPVASAEANERLIGMSVDQPSENAIEAAAVLVVRSTSPICDVRGSDSYRREIADVLVRRGIREALRRLRVAAPTV